MTDTEDPISFLFDRGMGEWLTPLRGKVPVLDSWPTQPPTDQETVRMWLGHSYNVGFRTGSISGLVVVDDDQSKHDVSGTTRYVPPPTNLIAETPSGGRHYFYRAPAVPLRNSASKLAPYVDVRADAGQVAVAPSTRDGKPYRWIETGDPGTLPPETLAVLTGPVVDMTRPHVQPSGDYAGTALVREAARVRAAPEGTRNEQLNRAAFNLGQLVEGGALSAEAVRSELASAASVAGLSASEAAKTIESGIKGGAKSPRAVPDRSPRIATAPLPTRTPTDVLIPGSFVMPGGEFIEQGNHKFADAVLSALDSASLYRRGGSVGELHEGRFVSISSDRMRSIVDSSVRLIATKKTEEEVQILFRTCTRDHASVVLEYAAVRGSIRELKHIATHPVCTGPEFTLSRPGWNADSGVYQTCSIDIAPIDVASARAVLEDLVCDFPFASPADRANYFGLLLTVILRPAIAEPVPMHLIGSSMERTGKTKLAEIVLGCGVLGGPTPAMQIGVREEEREKRIAGALLGGDAVIHLDNLRDFVDSPALASLLTSTLYRGRELGHTRLLSLPNGVTIVGTGNNIHATGEISKRIVPITLQPTTSAPESRQDYRHPLLRAYVESQRPRVLSALVGLVRHWQAAGRPLGSVGFGGFERWSAVVGGIMVCAGYPEWCSNLAAWRGSSDDFGGELDTFIKLWWDAYGHNPVAASELFKLANESELFSRQLNQTTERGQRTAFGQRVMAVASNRVVDGMRVELDGSGSRRRARLV